MRQYLSNIFFLITVVFKLTSNYLHTESVPSNTKLQKFWTSFSNQDFGLDKLNLIRKSPVSLPTYFALEDDCSDKHTSVQMNG